MYVKREDARGLTYDWRPLSGVIHEPRSVTSDVQAKNLLAGCRARHPAGGRSAVGGWGVYPRRSMGARSAESEACTGTLKGTRCLRTVKLVFEKRLRQSVCQKPVFSLGVSQHRPIMPI